MNLLLEKFCRVKDPIQKYMIRHIQQSRYSSRGRRTLGQNCYFIIDFGRKERESSLKIAIFKRCGSILINVSKLQSPDPQLRTENTFSFLELRNFLSCASSSSLSLSHICNVSKTRSYQSTLKVVVPLQPPRPNPTILDKQFCSKFLFSFILHLLHTKKKKEKK